MANKTDYRTVDEVVNQAETLIDETIPVKGIISVVNVKRGFFGKSINFTVKGKNKEMKFGVKVDKTSDLEDYLLRNRNEVVALQVRIAKSLLPDTFGTGSNVGYHIKEITFKDGQTYNG